MKFVYWIMAWLVMFLLLYVLSKSKSGHVVIYYTAWLLVFFLIVSHFRQLATILKEGGFSSG